jgi:HEAT repeat protein
MKWLKTLRLKSDVKSKNPDVRRRAIEQMAVSVKPETVALLIASLDDKDNDVRFAAAEAIGRIKPGSLSKPQKPLVIQALVKLLKDHQIEVRQSAAATLKRMGWEPTTDDQTVALEIASGNLAGVARLGEAGVDALIAELSHPGTQQRRAAVEALGKVDDPRTAWPLLSAMNDPDSTVKVSAIRALAKNTSNDVAAALLKTLWDPNPHARLAAAEALAEREDPDLMEHFIELLRDEHFEVKLVAVRFLAKLNIPILFEQQMVPLLSDPDADVRRAVIKVLGSSRNPAFIGPLIMALVDEERPVRETAVVALDQINTKWALTEAAKQTAPALEKALENSHSWVRTAAAQVLGRIKGNQDADAWKAGMIPVEEDPPPPDKDSTTV